MAVNRRGFLGALGAGFLLACKGSDLQPKPPRKLTDEEYDNSLVDLNFSSRISSFLDKDFNPQIHYQSLDFKPVDDLKLLRKNFLDLLSQIQNHLNTNRKHTLVASYKELVNFMKLQKISLPEYLRKVKPEWLANPQFYMDDNEIMGIINRATEQCCIAIENWLEKTKQLFVNRKLIQALSRPTLSNPA